MSNKNNTTHVSGGIGFCGMLTIVFIALKLMGHITWSWWWVFSPIWLPWAIVIGVFGIAYLISIFVK